MSIDTDDPFSVAAEASMSGKRAAEVSDAGDARRAARQAFAWLTVDRMLVAGICLASVGFFAVAYSISLRDPDYFGRQALATMQPSDIDPIMTGTVATSGDAAAMPVPQVVRAGSPAPADYQIVMVFEREAILATDNELWRVKVGSLVPGLGEILAVDPTETGGIVTSSEATLRSVSN